MDFAMLGCLVLDMTHTTVVSASAFVHWWIFIGTSWRKFIKSLFLSLNFYIYSYISSIKILLL